MDNVINLIPEKWQRTALLFLALSPYITRALHALYFGKGIRGVMAGIWLGTNSPSKIDPTPPAVPNHSEIPKGSLSPTPPATGEPTNPPASLGS